jgi:hypothetical protein
MEKEFQRWTGKVRLIARRREPVSGGSRSEMTVVSCGVKDGDATTFTCGVMVK